MNIWSREISGSWKIKSLQNFFYIFFSGKENIVSFKNYVVLVWFKKCKTFLSYKVDPEKLSQKPLYRYIEIFVLNLLTA